MHTRDQRTQITFMDIDLIINSNFIRSQQTQRKKSLHQIDLQETIVLRIKKREEAIQLLPTDPQVYGEILMHHRRSTNEDDEPLRDRVPLRQAAGIGLQIGSRGSRTCRGYNCVSSTRLGFLEYLGIYRAERRWKGPSWAPPPIRVHQGPLAWPGGWWAPWAFPRALPWLPSCLLGRKKSPKSSVAFGLCLVLIFCEVKNKQKTTTGTGHYVNMQSQKMI